MFLLSPVSASPLLSPERLVFLMLITIHLLFLFTCCVAVLPPPPPSLMALLSPSLLTPISFWPYFVPDPSLHSSSFLPNAWFRVRQPCNWRPIYGCCRVNGPKGTSGPNEILFSMDALPELFFSISKICICVFGSLGPHVGLESLGATTQTLNVCNNNKHENTHLLEPFTGPYCTSHWQWHYLAFKCIPYRCSLYYREHNDLMPRGCSILEKMHHWSALHRYPRLGECDSSRTGVESMK